MDNRSVAMGLAGIRMGIGVALVAAPAFAGRTWVGSGIDSAGTKVFARALGARDVVLGYRTMRAAIDREEAAGWLEIGALADAADTVAAGIAFSGITGHRRYTMPLVSSAMGLACFWAARQGVATAQDAAEDVAPSITSADLAAEMSGTAALVG